MKHCKSVEFLSVFTIPNPPHKRKAPLVKLSSSGSESAAYSSFVHKKPNHTQMNDQTKIVDGSKCFILGDQDYFV